MVRRGVTLVEILVALSVFMVVGGGVMYVLGVQNKAWNTSADEATMNLTAKATLDELSRGFRKAGSGLPDLSGGMKVYGSGDERVVLVMNEAGGQDTVLGWTWEMDTKRLRIAVHDASRMEYLGYARLALLVPAPGFHSGSGVAAKNFTLGVVDRTNAKSACGDSVILDVSQLMDLPNGWDEAGDIVPLLNGLVQNIDSITFRKANDTLYVRRNIQDSTAFATGVDSLSFWYRHPVDGWRDSLSGSFPSNTIDKVRIRLVFRTPRVDSKLLARDHLSRGYRFSRMQMDIALRNLNLTNL